MSFPLKKDSMSELTVSISVQEDSTIPKKILSIFPSTGKLGRDRRTRTAFGRPSNSGQTITTEPKRVDLIMTFLVY